MLSRIVFFILCLSSFNNAISDTIFTYREKESPNDTRYEYDRRLIELALQKTKATHGPYKLIPSNPGSNERRVINESLSNKYENFFSNRPLPPNSSNRLDMCPFPSIVELSVIVLHLLHKTPHKNLNMYKA